MAAAKIAFNAASGANLETLVRPEDLLVANSRFESTTWTALVVGPPLGGAAVGLVGPVTTVMADAVSWLEHTVKRLVARVLAAWSVSTSLATAALTALWGVIATLTSPRVAIAAAGVLLLATPLLLPRREYVPEPEREAASAPVSAQA